MTDIVTQSKPQEEKFFDVALLAGVILAKSGAETYRIEETVERILSLAPHRSADAVSMTTGLYLTLTKEDGTYLSAIRRIRSREIHLGKIEEVNRVSRELCAGILEIEEAKEELLRIQQPRPSWVKQEVFTVLAGVAFALMLGSGGLECFISILGGCALVMSQRLFRSQWISGFVPVFFEAMLTTMTFGILSRFFSSIDPQRLTTAVLMILFPGTTLTSGIRDMIHGDYLAGAGNLLHALVTAAALAIGAGVGFYLAGGVYVSI